MGVTVPVSMNIKDRSVYQTLQKMAKALSRSAIITLVQTDTVSITDDGAITNTGSYALQESFEVTTGIPWEDFNKDDEIYSFTAGFSAGTIGFTPGDPNEPSVYLEVKVKPVSFSDDDDNIKLTIDFYVRGITSVTGGEFLWKAKKLN